MPDPISRNNLPPFLDWPKIKWQSELWLALIPFILGFVVLFVPEITINSSLRWIIGIPLCFAPLAFPILIWLWKTGNTVVQRVKFYELLHLGMQQLNSDIEELHQNYSNLAEQVTERRKFEITKVAYINGKMIITIPRKKSPKINEGDSLAVFHTEDGLHMGTFQATDIRTQEIYAKGVSGLNPLWTGYVKQQGETTMTPNLVAIHMPQEK